MSAQTEFVIEPSCRVFTLLSDLDGARGFDSLSVFEPFSRDVGQRNLTHEDGVLILLNLQIIQILQHLQLLLWPTTKLNIQHLHSFTESEYFIF